MGFRGVIFDLDGTLVNSIEDIADSMNTVLRTYGFPTHNTEAYKGFVGHGMRNLVVMSLPADARDDGQVSTCRDALLAEYGRNYIRKSRPYEGVAELLDELVRRKIGIAVFSNKIDHLTKKMVAALLPKWCFAAIVGASEEFPEKPDPKGVLFVSRQMGIEPNDLIYVGDSDVDMITAVNAGMFPAGALWGFRTRDELATNGARYLLAHPMDVIEVLEMRG